MTSKQRGFSLIEVLISFLLIGVASLGLVKLQVYAEQKSDFALHSVEALHFAERQMEYYRTRVSDVSGAVGLIPFSQLNQANYCLNTTSSDPLSGLSDSGYAMTCEVENAAGALSGALKSITVSVAWQDRMNRSQSIYLETMLSKYSEFD
ncbi:prepilin-type N-terminal cleavage/methylation domain-containing protein [Vibrio splendidus]|uniref:Prepilin-type N-terminal cleavage/methylation domain-containing protein n=1 Tax=Vibrio splendidus TaxID=29497 RepID=A0A1B9QGL7_VIBSP|nr:MULTISPECIES: prepilin-type N-terminal cleavage/methylation domain-containing protein [Vibrio]HAH01737.1 prepilin-type N-terminal cleavage/methylation domain-containing protein [Vibrio sp.]MBE8566828.1 prepilin-type N-terminal cleavage/methylation domain-containing protein [Vibrio sp. OPT20]MBT9242702.1 prepilin-type N-terminal cleavage/methylation domain-containing protein [Vibrio splendidus]MBU2910160.1 prepilin-type N-terminal cleavage/methylation domain-containing protein [Vibrio splendi